MKKDIKGARRGFLTVYGDRLEKDYPGACQFDWDYLRRERPAAFENFVALALHPSDDPTEQQGGYEYGFNCGRCIKGKQ